ncbi:small ribosomal subunit protein mS26-like [Diadema setosum]|uniref:small ribosomal subunit protein mS26-like n=1 Tax=Diadema setosum TaxID=31175 RepID=UPI003B3BC446
MLNSVKTSLWHAGAIERLWAPVNAGTSIQLQQIRWRKRRTDPKAKSKEGRVREPTPRDPWEQAFFSEKLPHYKTTLRSIRRMFAEELHRKKGETAEGLSSEQVEREEEEEFRNILLWNEEENARIAAKRTEKLAAKARLIEEANLQRLLEKERWEAEEVERLTELVQREKEASKSFITMETMEAAIEEALDNPKNYNFLIKRTGKPVLPSDTAWEQFRQRTLAEEEQESQEKEDEDMKMAEN